MRRTNNKAVPHLKSELVRAAGKVRTRLESRHSEVMRDRQLHGSTWLNQYCQVHSIRVKFTSDLPGKGKAAFLQIEGVRFLVLRTSLREDTQARTLAMAHELGHHMLGHLGEHSLVALGYSGLLSGWSPDLQVEYHNRIELEADLAALMIVMPDAFLDQRVEDFIFIPVRRISHESGLPTDWVAARVQLYRLIYGYSRSRHLLELRNSDPLSSPNLDRWFSNELSDRDWLSQVLRSAHSVAIGSTEGSEQPPVLF